jgi:hypothetical protein
MAIYWAGLCCKSRFVEILRINIAVHHNKLVFGPPGTFPAVGNAGDIMRDHMVPNHLSKMAQSFEELPTGGELEWHSGRTTAGI